MKRLPRLAPFRIGLDGPSTSGSPNHQDVRPLVFAVSPRDAASPDVSLIAIRRHRGQRSRWWLPGSFVA